LLLGLAIDADYCFDMHCDNEALVHLYTGVSMIPDLIDLSAEMGSAATMVDDDSGGGPFDEAVGGLWFRLKQQVGDAIPIPVGCHSCTIEYRGKADLSDALAESDAAALIRFMQRRGVIAGEPGDLPQKLCEPTPLSAVDMVRAPCAGLVSYHVDLGQKVSAGEVIAEIVDPAATDPSAARTPVVTEQDGFVLTRLIMKLVRSGDSLAKVVGTQPLASRTGTLLPP
ncbi:MAG: succinylglutamate desuccinylase/aspartoacylase family protein, partial [Pseudomonadota bacterium]